MHPFAAILVLALTPTLPQSAGTVDTKKDAAGEMTGNVRVTFTDGHTELWTRQGKAMLPKVASNGLVGWAAYAVLGYRNYPVFDHVRVVWPDEHHRDFQASDSFIEAWDFADDNTALIIKSREAHGAADFLKVDLATGNMLAHVDGGREGPLPAWAKPYADR